MQEVSGYLSSGGGDASNPSNKATTAFPAPKAAPESTASIDMEKMDHPHAILNNTDPLNNTDASMAGFLPGEKVRAIDLLYGAMLPSGAECCIGLAEKIAGSEKDFVAMMNQKAMELGMESTHFENATGLHNENHYTSVRDLSVLLRYALQNKVFREIFTSSRHSVPPTNKHPDGTTFSSTLFDDLNNPKLQHGEILGGKTGYTAEAGQCLASLAKVGKSEYVLISAGAKGDHQSAPFHIADALTVYNRIVVD